MIHKTKKFFIPENSEKAFNIIRKLDDKFAFLAGGITINWRGNIFPYLISLEKIIDSTIIENENKIYIGAGIKLSELIKLKGLNLPVFKALYQSANLVASPQIRYMATLGGNMLSHFDFSDTLGFLYLIEPELEIINENGNETKHFSDFVSEKNKRFSLPKKIILNRFCFNKKILNKYDTSVFVKESRVGRDIATINVTTLKYKNENKFDIAVGSCWINVQCFKNINSIEQLKKEIKELKLPKSDNRASSSYRTKILIPLIERSFEKCLKK